MSLQGVITYDAQSPPITILALFAAASCASRPLPFTLSPQQAPAQQKLVPTINITQNDQKHSFVGVCLLARYLARVLSAEGVQLYGEGAIQATNIDFFVDLSTLCSNKDTLNDYATLLNSHLSTRTVLVGQQQSIADWTVFEALFVNPRWQSFVKTQKSAFPHLFRWFDLIKVGSSMLPALSAVSSVHALKHEQKLSKSKEGAGFDVEMPGAVDGQVVTRFPPEPSGYLHIGHAKAALLNDAIAKKYNGKMILRFDDTNPQKEKEEYVDNILADLARLGVTYSQLTHTSDHFDLILAKGEEMLRKGKAYIDNTPVEQMRKWRMDGVESPNRNQSLEENLRLWKLMIAGDPEGCKCVMRAKIDMQCKNKAMRDPTLFRCNVDTPHHRTGTKYKCYPTYDFACPIVDSIEGVTHCLRTNEYRDRNEQFYWMIDSLGLRKPYIRDYSRLNFVYTVLSKRKLQWFVSSKLVDGWNDPRFPTIQGILRRGMTVEALREFILGQGFSMSTNTMEWDKIWTINKRTIDPIAPRFTAITKENTVVLTITNASAQPDILSVDLHPKTKSVGRKVITRSNQIILEQDDAKAVQQGEEVTLMNWGNCFIRSIETNASGVVTSMTGELNLAGDPKTTDKKLTWLDWHANTQLDAVPVTFVELDTLITVPKVEEGTDFESIVNPKTRFETAAIGEPALRNLQKGDIIQIQRRGFFIVDEVLGCDSTQQSHPLSLIFIPDGRMKAMSTLSTKVDKAKLMQSQLPA